MKGIVLFDRDMDNPYTSGDHTATMFESDAGLMRINHYSSGTLEKAAELCKEHNLPLHILVSRWNGDKESFLKNAQEALKEPPVPHRIWWYRKLQELKTKAFIHISKRGYHIPNVFLDTVSRSALGVKLPTREYLNREVCLQLGDIQDVLLVNGWLTAGNKVVWEYMIHQNMGKENDR